MTKKFLKKIENFVESNPEIRAGQYVFKGTRLPVYYVVEHFEKGWSAQDVAKLFPELSIKLIFDIKNIIFEQNTNEEAEKIKITWLSYA